MMDEQTEPITILTQLNNLGVALMKKFSSFLRKCDKRPFLALHDM